MQTDAAFDRRERLALMARAKRAELAEPLAALWPDERVTELRKPETGLVMVRGRTGGDGAAFNLGEATMTRAAVQLATGERGFGQCLGREPALARLIAVIDAIAEREPQIVASEILVPIRDRLAAQAQHQAMETAATRVDFFTLVRGDPEA